MSDGPRSASERPPGADLPECPIESRVLRAALAHGAVLALFGLNVYSDVGKVFPLVAVGLAAASAAALLATWALSPDPGRVGQAVAFFRQLPAKTPGWCVTGSYGFWTVVAVASRKAVEDGADPLDVLLKLGAGYLVPVALFALCCFEGTDSYRRRHGLPPRPRPVAPQPAPADPDAEARGAEYDDRLRNLALGIRTHYLRLKRQIESVLPLEEADREIQTFREQHARTGTDLGRLLVCAERCAGTLRDRHEKIAVRVATVRRFNELSAEIAGLPGAERFPIEFRDHLDPDLPLDYVREAGQRLLDQMERLRTRPAPTAAAETPPAPAPAPEADRLEAERRAAEARVTEEVRRLEERREAEIREVLASPLERTQKDETVAFVREDYERRISDLRRTVR